MPYKDLEKMKAYQKEYYRKPGMRELQRAKRKAHNQTYKGWKGVIIRAGHTTSLTKQDFNELKSNPCSYCGSEALGIDRVDNSKEYLADNCVACCRECNGMKSAHSLDEWVQHMKKVLLHLGY